MIYIDQPIGTGFSYGTGAVDSTAAAVPFIWWIFQGLFESKAFDDYASREFTQSTSSIYLTHHPPSFISVSTGCLTLQCRTSLGTKQVALQRCTKVLWRWIRTFYGSTIRYTIWNTSVHMGSLSKSDGPRHSVNSSHCMTLVTRYLLVSRAERSIRIELTWLLLGSDKPVGLCRMTSPSPCRRTLTVSLSVL